MHSSLRSPSRVALWAALVLTTLAAPSGAQNLLVNGSFEVGPPIGGGGFTTVPSGSTDIAGWTVLAQGNVDVVALWSSSDGALSIDLDGTAPGGLAQSFATVSGQSYEVQFDLAGNPLFTPLVKQMRVEVDGGATYSSDHDFNISCFSTSVMGWKRVHFVFVAAGPSSSLSFRSLHPIGQHGPAIDNVVVNDANLPVGYFDNYCVGAPNSSFCSGAVIRPEGSWSVADNAFVLNATHGIPSGSGLFYYGGAAAQQAFGAGFRCVAGGGAGVHRLGPPSLANAFGTATRSVDLTQPPQPAGAILPGSTWYFQYWYRDVLGPSGFNLSDGARVRFCL